MDAAVIFAAMPNARHDAGFVEKAMSAVADPYRMKILQEIRDKGFVRCSDAVSLTGLSQPTCSHHIRLLVETDLITCRKEGRNNFFSLNHENFRKLELYLAQFANLSRFYLRYLLVVPASAIPHLHQNYIYPAPGIRL